MSRYVMKSAQIFMDLFVLSLSLWLAFFFRFEFNLQEHMLQVLLISWPYMVGAQYLFLSFFGVPRFAWRYIGLQEAKQIAIALSYPTGIFILFRLSFVYIGGHTRWFILPFSVLIMHFIMSFLGITGMRALRRILSEREERIIQDVSQEEQGKRTLLIGAGRAGVMVAQEIEQNRHLGIEIVGFIDDDEMKQGMIVRGYPVLGASKDIPKIAEKYDIEQAIITMASASSSAIRFIVKSCEKIALPVKIIPGIYEILGGKVNLSRIREVTIEDLLGRDAVTLDMDALAEFLSGKRVLVTGAGGSIGSEICRQVGRFHPEKLILLEQAETALFHIHQELLRTQPDLNTVPCIADICDTPRVEKIFDLHRPEVVFHAAAHKHVPMMEWNPGEAIKNNVFGTKSVADTADKFGVTAFVMISTDKAVNPTSVMGTTKRLAEIYIQNLSSRSKTKFVAVRFGNVLGSAGSVIPTFKAQIARGGPVTVTHPKMKRYFMTIPEACQLVMQAATMGKGGEIFVLDMGEPVYIVDLARDLIHLSGFTEDEIPIKFMGLRPGEKLFEELSTDSEHMSKTRHSKIFIGEIEAYSSERVHEILEELAPIINSTDVQEVRQVLARLVPEMQLPANEVEEVEEEKDLAPNEEEKLTSTSSTLNPAHIAA